MEQTAKVKVSDLQSNDTLVCADDEKTISLWLRCLVSSAEDIHLEPTQRFLLSIEKEKEWVTSLNDLHHQRRIAQLCILEWKDQNPPGRFLGEHSSDLGWFEEVDVGTVERNVLRYFATWTAAMPPGVPPRKKIREEDSILAMAQLSNTWAMDLRSNAIVSGKKILGAWQGVDFKRKLMDAFNCELNDCDVVMKNWLDPLTSENVDANDFMIDLNPLKRQLAVGLFVDPRTNSPVDRFLPSSIYVRRGYFAVMFIYLGIQITMKEGVCAARKPVLFCLSIRKLFSLDHPVLVSPSSSFWLPCTVPRRLSQSIFDRLPSEVKMSRSSSCFPKMT